MAIEFLNGSQDLAVDHNGQLFNGSLVKIPYQKDRDGFLVFMHNGSRKFVHEEVYKHFIGPISAGEYIHFKDDNRENVSADNLKKIKISSINMDRNETYYDYIRTKYFQKNPEIAEQIMKHFGNPAESHDSGIKVQVEVPDEVDVYAEAQAVDELIDNMKENVEEEVLPEPDPALGYDKSQIVEGMDMEDHIALRTLARLINEYEMEPKAAKDYLNSKGVTKSGKAIHHSHIKQCREYGYID